MWHGWKTGSPRPRRETVEVVEVLEEEGSMTMHCSLAETTMSHNACQYNTFIIIIIITNRFV